MDPWLDILIIIVMLPFVVLQLCMVVFLARTRRHDEMLRNGFFTIFMAISVADCIYMTAVDFLIMFPAAGFFRDFYTNCTVCPNIFVGLTDYLAQFQLLAHTAIAVNRFTAFGSELIHARLWEDNGLKLIIFGLFVASLALTAYEIPFNAHYIRMKNGSLNGIVLDDETLDAISTFVNCFIFSSLTLADLGLAMATMKRIRKYAPSVAQRPENQRLQKKLLYYSVYMSIVKLTRAFYWLFLFFALYVFPSWTPAIAYVYHPMIELYCFSGTVFILATSAYVRRRFLGFYRLRKSTHTQT